MYGPSIFCENTCSSLIFFLYSIVSTTNLYLCLLIISHLIFTNKLIFLFNSSAIFDENMLYLFIEQDFGKCPITGEPLSLDDIVPITTGKVCL